MKDIRPTAQTTATELMNTTIFFLILAPIVTIFYISYVFNPVHAGNPLLYVMQLIADSISILVILSLWLTIIFDIITPTHHRPLHVRDLSHAFKKNPTIDILVPVAGEPIEVIEKTLRAVVAMEYPHKTYVLDDGKSEEVEKLAAKLKATYITRPRRDHAKAGNLNNGLTHCKGEFFAIFDADQVPRKDFITKLLPYLANPEVAMVQSPQYFDNRQSLIAAGTSEAQEIFYKYVCPAKNVSNSVFCVGTNVVFRRKAIDEIGGIHLSDSEDIWTSLELHERGWKSIFVNEILAIGKAPTGVISYFKQQLRWAKGGLRMMFVKNTLFSKYLNLDQRIQYFSSNIFFLVGFSILIYILFPILYLLFGVTSLRTDSTFIWLLHYIPFFLLYYLLTWLLIGKLSIAPLATAAASFYPYLLAFFSTVFGTKHEWVATTSKKTNIDVMMKWIWPHVLIILLTIFSFIIGWYEPDDVLQTLLFTIWAGWNMYLLIRFLTSERQQLFETVE